MDKTISPAFSGGFEAATGSVQAASLNPSHGFSKTQQTRIHLLEGLGVEGDAHCGETVKHRSRVAKDPTQPNLRQVHLLHVELFAELSEKGFDLKAGDIGENILTRGLDLLGMPVGTRLHIGGDAVVELTGLRNPCVQLNDFIPGLMQAVLDKDENGDLVRKAGVMGIVLQGGWVVVDDTIRVELPPEPHLEMERV